MDWGYITLAVLLLVTQHANSADRSINPLGGQPPPQTWYYRPIKGPHPVYTSPAPFLEDRLDVDPADVSIQNLVPKETPSINQLMGVFNQWVKDSQTWKDFSQPQLQVGAPVSETSNSAEYTTDLKPVERQDVVEPHLGTVVKYPESFLPPKQQLQPWVIDHVLRTNCSRYHESVETPPGELPQWYIDWLQRNNHTESITTPITPPAYPTTPPQYQTTPPLHQTTSPTYPTPPPTLPPPSTFPPPPPPPVTTPRPPPSQPGCPTDVVHEEYGRHGYFYSWLDQRSRELQLNWQQASNFCRSRCLELVSIETRQENDLISSRIQAGRIRGAWTSGRKCDFPGCDRPELQPIDVYGWYWEGTRQIMAPTTDRFANNWSSSGPGGKPQPDNYYGGQGDNESCLTVLNNAYSDGIKWHDEKCSIRKPFICETNPGSSQRPKSLQLLPRQQNHNFQYFTSL